MKRNRFAKVLPVPDTPDRFYAVLYVDGLRSDWDCGHRHLYADSALACVAAVEADADLYLDNPRFTEQSLGIAGAGLWSGPVEVLRHMEWRTATRRRAFVLGSDRALSNYLHQRALGGRASLPAGSGSPRGDHRGGGHVEHDLDRGPEHPGLPGAESGDQPEVL